jgi:hypothetical protein
MTSFCSKGISALLALVISLSIQGGALAQVSTPAATGSEIQQASGNTVAGDAFHLFDGGLPDQVSVLAFNPDDGITGSAVIRNNTQETVIVNKVTVVAYKGDGNLFGVAETAMVSIAPSIMAPGAISLVWGLSFVEEGIPAGTEFQFQFETLTADDPGAQRLTAYEFESAVKQRNTVVGEVINTSSEPTSLSPFVYLLCFDSSGQIVSSGLNNTPNEIIKPGESDVFQVAITGDASGCEYFLVGAWSMI